MSVTPSRERSRRGEGDQLRDDLLEAAADLLAEHGSVDKVSLRAVAQRTGVSPTAVYRHFTSHDELMIESVLWCWREFDEVLGAVLTEPGADPFDAFKQMGDAYLHFAMEKPGRYKVLFTRDLMELEPVEEVALLIFAKLIEVVDQMFEANNDQRDSFFVASQVHTWLHGIIGLCVHHPDDDTSEHPFPLPEVLVPSVAVALGLVPNR